MNEPKTAIDAHEESLLTRIEAILNLRALGYDVIAKTEYHYRINDRLDVWPVRNRWHDLKTRERGGCGSLPALVVERIRPSEYGRK